MPRYSRRKPDPVSPNKVRLDGLFQDGQWLCNCVPRMPATQLQVRKKNANQGRWFFTCQRDRKNKDNCGFFLWAEDAESRAKGAVLSNSRSEPQTPAPKKFQQTTLHGSVGPRPEGRREMQTPITGQKELNKILVNSSARSDLDSSQSTVDGDPPSRTRYAGQGPQPISSNRVPSNAVAGAKRKRSNDDEFSDFSSDEERQLAAITDSTSSKEALPSDAFFSPAPMRMPDSTGITSMPTPLTEKPVRRVLFADAPSGEKAGASLLATPSSSPFGDPTTPGFDPLNLTQEVMALLKGQKVDVSALKAVESLCERTVARFKGLEKGRDASRNAVKAAEDKMSKMQERIVDLENQRNLDSDKRRKLRELMKGYMENE